MSLKQSVMSNCEVSGNSSRKTLGVLHVYWIEWIEDGEKKSIVAEEWLEWAAVLEDLYQKRFEYVEWKRL